MTDNTEKPLINPSINPQPNSPKVEMFTAKFKPFTSFGFNNVQPSMTPKYEITKYGDFKVTMVPNHSKEQTTESSK
jgi:hypothetical protein